MRPTSLTFTYAALVTISVAAIACGPAAVAPDSGAGGAADAQASSPDAAAPMVDARPVPEHAAVFAHSATELFQIDPNTLTATVIGTFTFDGPGENITDIAVDKGGTMIAISLNAVFSVDPATAAATRLATFPQGQGGLTSLSFVPRDLANPGSAERLVGADFDGVVWEIDPATGQRTMLGNYNQAGNTALGSSGDIVAIVGFGILATINIEGEPNDFLARIDPLTWQATVLGDTGHDKIFGIGFWGGSVYGFTDQQDLLTMDPFTGSVTGSRDGDVRWWGAGVTTLAPVVE